ncbi:FlgB family protein [Yoonia sp. 2307UL14-13]|uniref:FlgB family protein n=1 Tax=Yoonia sp. 2307UL14-13 TaxID=3126506 RepID=UPI0030B227AB
MYQSLDLFETAAAMAEHAGRRQAVVARNIANADTPGFSAASIPSFSEIYRADHTSDMRLTRPGHMSLEAVMKPAATTGPQAGQASPDGNTVSIEDEMLNAVAISREHNRALTIYRHTMTVLRTTLGQT